MPIINLTQTEGHLPEIGRLRKGAPQTEDPKPGMKWQAEDLDHFRFTAPEPDLVQEFYHVYGPEPKSVDIHLPYATMDENFETWMLEFGKRGLARRCDGQTIWQDEETATGQEPRLVHTNKPCVKAQQGHCLCKATGLLHMQIIGINRFGVVKLTTRSHNDIRNLSGTLAHLEQFAARFGADLSKIPMRLSRHPQLVSAPRKDKKTGQTYRQQVTKHLLRIEPHPQWVALANQSNVFPWQQQSGGIIEGASTPALALPAPAPTLPAPEAHTAPPPPPQEDLTPYDMEPPPQDIEYRPPDVEIENEADLHQDNQHHEIETLVKHFGLPGISDTKACQLFSLILRKNVGTLVGLGEQEIVKIIETLQYINKGIYPEASRRDFFTYCMSGLETGNIPKEKFSIMQEADLWIQNQDLPF